MILQNELNKHNEHSNKKSIIICVLTILSTVDLFRGAEVWFIMSFVSCPVYITTQQTQEVFLNIAPRNSKWLGPKESGLKTKKYDNIK